MVPENIQTLTELLAYRAAHTPNKPAFIFNQQTITYLTLWDKIKQAAQAFHDLGVRPGDRVILMFPNGDEFFYCFYGAQLIRAIPVPITPVAGIERVIVISQLSGAKFVVVSSLTPDALLEKHKHQTDQSGLKVHKVNFEHPAEKMEFSENVLEDDISFIQFTSGSTGTPKGVPQTHKKLLINVQQMIAGMEITAGDIFVSWLPVFHDMGLILMTMAPFYLGTFVCLLPTSLKDLHPWLDTIVAHQGTFTAAPDFAYRLLHRHIPNPQDYDLSTLRVALNAAEPVRPETIANFHTAFNLTNVMTAGYGLAEATVGVSMSRPGKPAIIDSKGFVSVGPPFPEVELKILKDGKSAPAGEVGEILIKSPANTSGYYDQPEATADLFFNQDYIFSGDLGYLDAQNNLYIVGRKKNVIKYYGRTIAPKEIEEAVDKTQAVRFSAAIGIDKGRIEGEQIYVFAEIRGGESLLENEFQDIVIEIVGNIHARMGFRPARTLLLKPKSIPQTHNGKIQYPKLKEDYLSGSLSEEEKIIYPRY